MALNADDASALQPPPPQTDVVTPFDLPPPGNPQDTFIPLDGEGTGSETSFTSDSSSHSGAASPPPKGDDFYMPTVESEPAPPPDTSVEFAQSVVLFVCGVFCCCFWLLHAKRFDQSPDSRANTLSMISFILFILCCIFWGIVVLAIVCLVIGYIIQVNGWAKEFEFITDILNKTRHNQNETTCFWN